AALNRGDVEALDAARERGQREHMLQRFERVVLRGLRLVEARLVRDAGVSVREIDEAALLAALRHDDAHAASGAIGKPRLEGVAIVRLGRHVNLGRRAAQLVELLNRRLEPLALARSDNRLLGTELDALDDASGADLEDLNGDAGRPELQAEHVAVS